MPKNNYFELTTAQQRTVLEQTAIKQGLPKQAIEKDLWVTAILQIFSACLAQKTLLSEAAHPLVKCGN